MLLFDIIRRNAFKTPGRTALIVDGVEISFNQIYERACRLANALTGLARPGDRVGILAENIQEYIEAFYGVPAAGMALTLLNYRLNPKEWAWILDNAMANVLLVEQKFLDSIMDVRESIPSLEHVILMGEDHKRGLPTYNDIVGAASVSSPEVPVAEDDTAWMIYTSGTTGFPKGAMLTHRNLVIAAIESVIEYQPAVDERCLMAMPLCHVSAYIVLVNHLRGGLLALMKAYDPELWMRLVDQYAITSSGMAPTMINSFLQHPKIREHKLNTLTGLMYGAAPMPVDILQAAIDRLGPIVYSGFGMTELGGNVLTHPIAAHVRAIQGDEYLLASCGKPMCLVEVKVVNDDMQECKPGAIGEIVVRGEQVLKGYFGNEEGTAAAFHGGWFHSGDLARRDEEGYFYIVDRKKDMIVTGGENVYSREVENAIEHHPAVSEVAVIGLPDPAWGENVCAVVVLRPGANATEEEIVAACRDRLAGYKKPKRVVFVEELPRNVSGKILKRELRDQFS